MLNPVIQPSNKTAAWLIGTLSVVVFAAVVILSRVTLNVDLGFDPHIFADINAALNSAVSILLIFALIAVRSGKYQLHKRLMVFAIILSTLFLISYICHHLFAGDTRFGATGPIRYFYFVILITHIFLAAVILPFILYTAYRGFTGEWLKHRKLAKITWPIWLYVSVTGVIVYFMISPYY